MSSNRIRPRALHVESLESRCVLSFIFPVELHDHSDHGGDGLAADEIRAAKGGGGPSGLSAPAIRLDLVALHEFGHSLGLGHSSDTSSIMYAYYNAGYDLTEFGNDSAVATMRSLYANVLTSPWKDSLDSHAGNGTVDVTYSFVPDGARMDKGTSTTFATFDRIFPNDNWQAIFVDQLNLWANNSNGKLAFEFRTDDGLKFNYTGAAQNDSRAGDIRIAAHRFDGAGKVLAHAYFPPPNGSTAAGDAHFDQAENWVLVAAGAPAIGGAGASGGSGGNLVLAGWADELLPAAMLVSMDVGAESSAGSMTTTFASPHTQDAEGEAAGIAFSRIETTALATRPVWSQANAEWDEFGAEPLREPGIWDEGDSDSGNSCDLSWLDAIAWQRVEFGHARA